MPMKRRGVLALPLALAAVGAPPAPRRVEWIVTSVIYKGRRITHLALKNSPYDR